MNPDSGMTEDEAGAARFTRLVGVYSAECVPLRANNVSYAKANYRMCAQF